MVMVWFVQTPHLVSIVVVHTLLHLTNVTTTNLSVKSLQFAQERECPSLKRRKGLGGCSSALVLLLLRCWLGTMLGPGTEQQEQYYHRRHPGMEVLLRYLLGGGALALHPRGPHPGLVELPLRASLLQGRRLVLRPG